MPLKIPKRGGIAQFDSRYARGVILLCDKLDWSAYCDLKLVKNRNNISLKGSIMSSDRAPGF